MKINVPFEGGCTCGAVRYRCDKEPFMTFKCHCVDCQKASGGPFVAGLLVPIDGFRFTKGTPTYYLTPSTAGGKHKRGFCGTCGSRLTGGQSEEEKPFIGLCVASLDDASTFKADMNFFVSQAQPWDEMEDDIPKYPLYPPK